MKSRALNLAALALLVSLCGWTGGGTRPAAAQALDAGKPPAQIFSGTCAACHRSPRGLVRNVSAGSLPGFLRQHYTTGNDMAGVMAAYVLGNGGTDRVAEPPPKREPKQKAKSDGQDVAAVSPDARELSKSAKQKAAKKGQAEPAAKDTPAPTPAAKDVPAAREAEKPEPAKQEAATDEPPKAVAAPVECKVEPPKPAVAAADETKPPKQPTSLLTLPGFPAPEPEPEAEPEPVAAAPAADCEPKTPTTTAASVAPSAEKELPKEPESSPAAAPTSAAVAEAPKIEPLRSAVTDTTAAMPSVDIMQEEVHAPRPRTSGQKKRAPQ